MNRTILALGLSAWLCGCGTDDSSDPGPDLIPQTYRVSECGGFQAASKADFTPQDYCAAEVLSWTYDKATHALKLTDSRALLNCCGDRTMTLTEKNGLYQIVETDAPQQGSGRCHCMCVFDLSVEVQLLPAATAEFVLKREVTDSGDGLQQIWRGQIDLSKGSGSVVLDSTDVGPWCSNH